MFYEKHYLEDKAEWSQVHDLPRIESGFKASYIKEILSQNSDNFKRAEAIAQ